MPDDNNAFMVSGLVVRETPTLTNTGRTAMTTVVTYSVGAHGPFTMVYPGVANSAQISKDITAKVNELRALTEALGALNVQMGGH